MGFVIHDGVGPFGRQALQEQAQCLASPRVTNPSREYHALVSTFVLRAMHLTPVAVNRIRLHSVLSAPRSLTGSHQGFRPVGLVVSVKLGYCCFASHVLRNKALFVNRRRLQHRFSSVCPAPARELCRTPSGPKNTLLSLLVGLRNSRTRSAVCYTVQVQKLRSLTHSRKEILSLFNNLTAQFTAGIKVTAKKTFHSFQQPQRLQGAPKVVVNKNELYCHWRNSDTKYVKLVEAQ